MTEKKEKRKRALEWVWRRKKERKKRKEEEENVVGDEWVWLDNTQVMAPQNPYIYVGATEN